MTQPLPAESRYELGQPSRPLRSSRSAVEAAIGRRGTVLLDVRSASEYRGERFWPSGGMEQNGRAGHIPSALHQPIDGLYNTDGSFRPAADLQGIFSAIDLGGQDELITYCTIGGRAATAWFVLTHLLGRANVSVYDGSWAEWGRLSDTPIDTSQSRHPQNGKEIPCPVSSERASAIEEIRPLKSDATSWNWSTSIQSSRTGAFRVGGRSSEHMKPNARLRTVTPPAPVTSSPTA